MEWFLFVYYSLRIYNHENVVFSLKKLRKIYIKFGLIYVSETKTPIIMTIKQYQGHKFQTSCDKTKEYADFEKQCKKELKAQCKKEGFNLHSFNPNHFEWSAVFEKDGKFIYVSLSDVRYWNWYDKMLIRTMAHDKDWSGGTNRYCSFDEIGSTATRLHEQQMRQAV